MPERADSSARWILRRAAKAAVAGALTAVGIHRAVELMRRRQAGGSRVLILSYHRVTPSFAASARESLPSLLVSASALRRQLEHVARRRELVPLATAQRILAEPARPGASDVAAVTFDDGYAEVVEHALPVLAELRVPATMFVPTGYVGTERRLPHDRLHASLSELRARGIPVDRADLPAGLQALLSACADAGPASTLDRLISRLSPDRLLALADALERRLGLDPGALPPGTRLASWDDLRKAQAAGVEVGGHTVNHAVLANLPLAEARREVEGCRDQLDAHLGARPRAFAYPNGYHTPAVRELVRAAGFDAALTTEDEENRHGGDPFALKRKVLWENSTLGAVGWSSSIATCNLAGVFAALGLQHPIPGGRPDPLPAPARPAGPEVERVAG